MCHYGAAVALVRNLAPPIAACRRVLEQDTEPHIAPDEQLAPLMAASAIGVGVGECDKC